MKSHCVLPPLSDILYNRHRLEVSNLVSDQVKAKRKRASPSQLLVLNRVFQTTFFPSTELRIQLGKQLGMSPRTVQIWFQNKRQSMRSQTRYYHKHVLAPIYTISSFDS